MPVMPPLFVEKLANSLLLAAFTPQLDAFQAIFILSLSYAEDS
jgi:hypothetical protein